MDLSLSNISNLLQGCSIPMGHFGCEIKKVEVVGKRVHSNDVLIVGLLVSDRLSKYEPTCTRNNALQKRSALLLDVVPET